MDPNFPCTTILLLENFPNIVERVTLQNTGTLPLNIAEVAGASAGDVLQTPHQVVMMRQWLLVHLTEEVEL
jgi:hypothetical protein